ncbi:DUF2254 family protein [Caenispirillum bisanense]|uniref:DUF2254 family protein n=1 Tax=Caenispirillum bisanense TaxID=414052 RepID=UPI000C777CB7
MDRDYPAPTIAIARLIVLTEIASRALSPRVDDPGTAINVIHAECVHPGHLDDPQAGAGAGASNVEVCLTVRGALKAILATTPHVARSAVAATAADLLTRVRSPAGSARRRAGGHGGYRRRPLGMQRNARRSTTIKCRKKYPNYPSSSFSRFATILSVPTQNEGRKR